MRLNLNQAKYRAKAAGVPFSLQREDVSAIDVCPICQSEMVFGDDTGRGTSPSLDRIVPELGYVKENVVVICGACNRRKGDSTPELLYAIADYIYRIREERGLC